MEASAHGISIGNWEEVGVRVAELRRRAGLSRKALAKQLDISLWTLEEVENGRKDAGPYADSITRVLGLPLKLEVTTVRSSEFAEAPSAPDSFATRAREVVRPPSGRELVLGSIALLVLIRFFTEVVPIVPRAGNVIDIPILTVLAIAAMARGRQALGNGYIAVALPAAVFFGICALSAMLNLSRVAPGPVLVFIYGFLSPLAVYAAVYRLWPPGNAISMSRLFVWLGVVQLAVVFTIDLPKFIVSGDPDVISGTFGTNQYQFVFFLLLFTGLIAGIFTAEPRRLAARAAPVLVLLALASILLAQYRALLVTTAVSLLLVAALLSKRRRGVISAAVVLISFVIALGYVTTHFPALHFGTTIATLAHKPGFYLSQRMEVARPVAHLYTDDPTFIPLGTGPGTFSSRGWQTFALARSTSRSNAVGPYVSALTGGHVYHTDVSDKYVLPQRGIVVQGSGQLRSPQFEYVSLLAEVGVFGFLMILAVYVLAAVRSVRQAATALSRATPGDPLPALLIASAVAFTALLQMGFLDNWLEVTRLTFVSWALLAVAQKELDSREGQ